MISGSVVLVQRNLSTQTIGKSLQIDDNRWCFSAETSVIPAENLLTKRYTLTVSITSIFPRVALE